MKLTKKKAIEISIELWEWLAESGANNKADWDGWDKYGYMWAGCALCEYENSRKKPSVGQGGCPHCPYCNRFGTCMGWPDKNITPFDDWSDATTVKTRKKYAKLFLAQLKELK